MIQRLKGLLREAPGAPQLRFLYRLSRAESRARLLLELERPRRLFQPEPTTGMDRYPDLFRFARERLGDGPDRRILSFGCSTGEEVFSLRRYFPQARIKGIDINAHSVGKALERLRAQGADDGLAFEVAASASAEPPSFYDAVFAMAVFRDGALGAAPPRCDHLIRFADFERSVADLARCLKPGGLLVLRHANFRFSDTGAAAAFDKRHAARLLLKACPTPIYGLDDALSSAPADDGVFEKLGE